MKRNGFTLIELMIVVAIIAILAAVALPAYQDYTTRAKVTELMVAVDACKVSVAEYYQTQGGWPTDQDASGCGAQETKFVSALVVGALGVITASAQVGAGALPSDAAGDVQLSPTVSPSGHLTWACNGPGTTIKKKYLPANCR